MTCANCGKLPAEGARPETEAEYEALCRCCLKHGALDWLDCAVCQNETVTVGAPSVTEFTHDEGPEP